MTDHTATDTPPLAPAVGARLEPGVGRLEPERCKDCGLTLVPWLRLWCTNCVQKHLTE
jgi:hypothetical protein